MTWPLAIVLCVGIVALFSTVGRIVENRFESKYRVQRERIESEIEGWRRIAEQAMRDSAAFRQGTRFTRGE